MRTHNQLGLSARHNSAMLRHELERRLSTDSELEAFCIDYFPQTYRLLASSMDRQQKMNLLLVKEDHGDIKAALVRDEDPQAKKHIFKQTSTADPDQFCSVPESYADSPVWRRTVLGALVLGILVFGIAGGVWHSQAQNFYFIRSGADILKSNPSGAEILDMRTGRKLGVTPWLIDPGLLPRLICLRRLGSYDKVLSLSERQLSQVPVELIPVGASSISSEACDVPIPIP